MQKKVKWDSKALKNPKVASMIIADLSDEGRILIGAKKKKKVSRPRGRHLTNEGKSDFCESCVKAGLPRPIPEYQPFLKTHGRAHRVDFFFQDGDFRMALEVEGWGHRTAKRFTEDIDKYNMLVEIGIWPVRCKPKELYTPQTIDILCRVYGNNKGK